MWEKRPLRWLLIFLGWTLLAVFFASQTILTYLYTGSKDIPAGLILQLSLGEWYVWALFAPAVVWLAGRFPLERHRLRRSLLVHIPVCLLLAVVKFQLDVLVRQYLLGVPGTPNVFFKLHPNILTYWVILGIAYAFDYYRRFRDREVKASRLEAQLAQARLQMLKMQLHPHFLFNTLHAVSALMHRDVEAADRMVARLSELLRLTLDSAEQQEVPLKQELEFLERYLEIEQTRFQDRLTVDLQIAPETLDARVPSLVLQPLVENAVRHGIARRSGPGRIEIRARRCESSLELQVRDDGPGLPPGAESAVSEGVGLANTRARLQQLYGPAAGLRLENAPAGGLVATIVVPWSPLEAGGAE